MKLDIALWASIASVAVALIAAGIALWSASISRRTLRLSELQQAKREPKFLAYLSEGFSRYDDRQRTLSFLISVTNQSDSNDSLSRIELQIVYVLSDGTLAAMRFMPGEPDPLHEAAERSLIIPQKVDAHQTIAGWLIFRYPIELLEGSRIDGYSILIQNSEGAIETLQHMIIKEILG